MDDKKTHRELVCKQIAELGHSSNSCHTLTDTLEFVKTWRPDCVLLDLRMPGHDGFYVIKVIRTEIDDPPYIVAMTGDATTEVRERAFEANFDEFLAKPFRKSELINLFSRIALKSESVST